MGTLNLPGVEPAIEQRVTAIDTETLTPLIQAVLDDENASVDEWNWTPIRGGVGGGYFGTALFRFDGTATTSSGNRKWSVVLKILAERPGEDPAGHPYWKREMEVYRSDFVQDVPGGLVPAEAYRTEEYPGESVWFWLEDLKDEYDGEWPLDQYRRTAQHLGQFNGAFLTGTDVPSEPWVIERSFDFTRTAGVVAFVDRVPDDPLVRRHFPTEEDRERLFAAWRNRDRFVAARNDLPRTFCHFDAFGRNLFATTTDDGTPRTVAIDWDQCGLARIGDDAGALVILTLMFHDWPTNRARSLEKAVIDGYRDGLATVGWDGPDDIVLRGYRLHLVNRWLEGVGPAVRSVLDERNHDWISEMVGNSIDEILDGSHDLHRLAFETIEELDLESSPFPSTRDGSVNESDDRE